MSVIFVIALLPRFALVVFWQITSPAGFFPDEIAYISQAKEIARGVNIPTDSNFWNSNWAFFRPLVAAAEMTHRHALVGRSAMAIAGSLLAVIVFLMGRRISVRAGLVAGIILALYPSQIFWSSMYLKDTLSALLLASICLTFATVVHKSTPRKLIFGSVLLTVLVTLSSGVRLFSALTAILAILLSGIWWIARRSSPRQRAIGLLLFLTAAGASFSALGDRIPLSGTSSNQEARKGEYEYAKTLISCHPIPLIPGPEPHESGWLNDLACAPFAARMVLFDPLPNQLGKSVSLIPPFVEHVLWWPLLYFAFKSWRNTKIHPEVLLCSLILCSGLIMQWALIDRVFGTAFRHRTEFFWVVALFGAIGITGSLKRREALQSDG